MISRAAAPIGVALLGYGAIAEFHARALRKLGARLVAVAGPKAEDLHAFSDLHGFERAELDPQAAIEADGVDAVIVASPSPVHAVQVRSAIQAGRHVLVEIPMALSLEEGDSLVNLAVANRIHLGVCHTERFREPFRFVVGELERLADPALHVVTHTLMRRRSNVGWTGRPRSWTDNLLWHHGGHAIDLTLQLLGTSDVTVKASSGRPQAGGPPLDYAIALKTIDGRLGTVALSYNALIERHDVLVVADRETWVIDESGSRASTGATHRARRDEFEQAVVTQDAAFFDSLRGGPRFPADGAAIIPTLRIQHAIATAS